MRGRLPRSRGNGSFTLIELLVVIAIITLLMAMLLPSLKQARQSAWKAVCTGNLRQLYVAGVGYAGDNDDYLPPQFNGSAGPTTMARFPLKLAPYLGYLGPMPITKTNPVSLGTLEIRKDKTYKRPEDTTTYAATPFYCPAVRGPFENPADPTTINGCWYAYGGIFSDYGINGRLAGVWNANINAWESTGGYGGSHVRLGDAQPASRIPLFADSQSLLTHVASGIAIYTGIPHDPRHFGMKNMVFVDGHAEADVVIPTTLPTEVEPFNMLVRGKARSPNFKYVLDPQ